MADDTSSASEATTSCVSTAGYSGEEESSVSEGCSVLSLLDKLRSPVPSELARKRKVSTNPPPVGQKRSKGGPACTVLKSVSPQDRVKEFADDSLCVSAGKLFCREELSVKKSVIKNHVESMKYRSSKGRQKEKEKRVSDIVDALQRYNRIVFNVAVQQTNIVAIFLIQFFYFYTWKDYRLHLAALENGIIGNFCGRA